MGYELLDIKRDERRHHKLAKRQARPVRTAFEDLPNHIFDRWHRKAKHLQIRRWQKVNQQLKEAHSFTTHGLSRR